MELKEYDETELCITASFEDAKMYQLKICIPIVLKEVQNRIDFVGVLGRDDNTDVAIRDLYDDGNYRLADFILEKEKLLEGRWITEEEATFGDKVALIPYEGSVGDRVVIAGESFEVIGVTNNRAAAEHSDSDDGNIHIQCAIGYSYYISLQQWQKNIGY